MSIIDLKKRWFDVIAKIIYCDGISCEPSNIDSAFDYIAYHYQEKHRYYHTLDHIAACLKLSDEIYGTPGKFPGYNDAVAIELAIWFHDIIYNPELNDNELKSSQVAKSILNGLNIYKDIKQLILITRHDVPPLTRAEQIVVDIDLSILGESQLIFDEYEKQIKQEYSWVPNDIYLTKRKEILERFYRQAFIYYTPEMRENREEQARENIWRSLLKLCRELNVKGG